MSNNKPAFNVVVATEGKDGKNYYTTIGAAWPNKLGGFNITLKAHPIGTDLLLFPPKTEDSTNN